MELDKELKQKIIKLIKEGKSIPVSFKNILFPPDEKPKEIELIYGIKERKEDILAETWAVPFQTAKRFGDVREGGWHSMLIFGDNLQALKFMLHNSEMQESIKKAGGIKLIYIDPPFGTGKLYDAAGVPAYSAALQGAAFVEFLRKRLIFLKGLLADDGSIYVRIDYHFGHYIKVVMDEIFRKDNFQNHIIIRRSQFLPKTGGRRFEEEVEYLLFYTKTSNYIHNTLYKEREPKWVDLGTRPSSKEKNKSLVLKGIKFFPRKYRRWAYSQKTVQELLIKGRVKIENNKIKILLDKASLRTNWTDIPGYSQKWNFPTENSEQLLERVIKSSSNPGDIVLDAFAGSGTTGAVAEKLGRKWIMVDSSKLAIYTMIKRMFNLKQEIGNKGNRLKPKPFVLYNAGLYEDHDFILRIGEEHYKKFAMDLFQVEPKKFEINGLEMNGMLFNCPVKVFSQKGYLTEEYIDELHNTVGKQLKVRMFIIAPASRVYFLQDYIEKDGIRYYILRIPYSIIDELHKRAFTRPMQPAAKKEINQLIEQVGFDFIHPPNVEAKYYRAKPEAKLPFEDELVIEMKKFEVVQRSKKPLEFKDSKDALSMVLVDENYNGEYFNMSYYFFKDQIEKDDWKVRIPYTKKVGEKIMIIYLDIFGNERVEVKSKKDFKKKK